MVDYGPHEIRVPKKARIGFLKSQIFDINIRINMTTWGCFLNRDISTWWGVSN